MHRDVDPSDETNVFHAPFRMFRNALRMLLPVCTKELRLDKIELRLLPRPTFRIFGFALDTPARQNASKLAFALAYSYLWLRLRYFRLGNAQINLAFRPAYSYLCSRY